MDNSKLIEIKNIYKYFPVKKAEGSKRKSYLHAVEDVSFSIKKKEIFGIVGESGSGKSTIGRCILQLLRIDKGEIYFHGVGIHDLGKKELSKFRQNMQMVFQNPLESFDPGRKIGSAYNEICNIHHMSKQERNRKIVDLLGLIGLPADVLNRMPNQLSGGQLQRLAIARALLLEPEFIVADEPVSALDVSVQAQILNFILDLRDNSDLTILFISHDLNVVEKICDTVAVVYLGTIVELASKKELFYDIKHPYTKALLQAKPIEHPNLRKERIVLSGDIPSAIDVAEGCRFAKRCPNCVSGVCDCKTPKLKEIHAGHYVACHYPLNEQRKEKK